MPLWLEHLLQDPALGLQLVAGKGGLGERGPVRWAHISEIPDPTPWLEGGEILLLTGLGVKDSPTLQRRLIALLDGCGCAGVGFGLGVWLDAVPSALLDESEARDLPMFTVPYEVPFIAVTRTVSEAIAAEHYAQLRAAVDVHRQVLAGVIAGAGAKGVIETIAVPEFASVVFDYYGRTIATHGPNQYPRRLWQVVAPQRRRERFEFAWGERTVTGSVVRVGDEIEAVLVLVGPRPLAEPERLLMEQGLAGLSLELARGLSVREARRSQAGGMLGEIAAGRAPTEAVTDQLEELGFRPAEAFRVLCLRRPPRVPERGLCALAEDAATAGGAPLARAIVGRWDGALYCIVQPADAPHAEHIAASARSRGWSGVVVGRSRAARGVGGLATALREAAVAASAPGAGSGADGVRDVTRLGLAGVLAGISDDLAAEAFVRQALGPVLEHELLLDTLRAFLRHGCRPGPAAAELCVHRHTLAYRLDRIRDLCGRDPRDGTHLLEYGLALELLDRR